MKSCFRYMALCAYMICTVQTALAAPVGKIDAPPLSERWFGIFVNNERVGFYRQRIDKTEDGYRFDCNGSVRMKVMSFAKEASMRETYIVTKGLALRSFNVEQTVNGSASHVSGTVKNSAIYVKNDVNGTVTDKLLKFKGEVYPGSALNFYPLMRSVSSGSIYRILVFDPEELKIKDVQIMVLGEEKTSDGQPSLKIRNNLYPFVTNDIWVDSLGNTVEESVRDGLVTTRAEQPQTIGAFISNWALAKQDLIYDFSLVRIKQPINDPKKLRGLAVEISGWNDAVSLLQGGGQQVEKLNSGRAVFKTGSLQPKSSALSEVKPADFYLNPAEKIESDSSEIRAQSKLLVSEVKSQEDAVKVLASWTADWLKDSIDDGGSAVASFKSKQGNCQTHARLYTALGRASGIPTRFVSGLVYLEGRGFLYHSWAESYIGDHWVSVDPTYNQVPADPTHLKLFEGHLPEDMAPIISIIGRIKLTVLETSY